MTHQSTVKTSQLPIFVKKTKSSSQWLDIRFYSAFHHS